jgi:hypothetical protein
MQPASLYRKVFAKERDEGDMKRLHKGEAFHNAQEDQQRKQVL